MTEVRSVVYWGWDGVAGMDYKGYKEIWELSLLERSKQNTTDWVA